MPPVGPRRGRGATWSVQGGWSSSLSLKPSLGVLKHSTVGCANSSPSSLLDDNIKFRVTYLQTRQSKPTHYHVALPDVFCPGSHLPCCLLACPSPAFWTRGWKQMPGAQATPQCRTCIWEVFAVGFVAWLLGLVGGPTQSAIFMINDLPSGAFFILGSCWGNFHMEDK